mgnify:CR=1 FL=1
MGIRRRRRRLTTLVSRLDQRVRSVELRPMTLLTSTEVNSAITTGESLSAPGSFVGAAAPNQFYKIEDAYIYPKAITGTEDRVEIYLEADLGLQKGDRIEVSGIHGTQGNILDADGDNFTVASLDTPPWTSRTLPNSKVKDDPTNDQRTGVIISNTYSFKPETEAPSAWNNYYRLQTKRAVDAFSITGTTVTLTMNAIHKFEAGDVIFVSIYAEDTRAYGTDGLFEIDSVTDTTIVYTLDAGVDTPTGDLDVDGQEVYAFPVARSYCDIGSTWTNSSNGSVYYWDGLRWVSWSTASLAPNDGDAPNPPTNLVVTAELNIVNNNYNSATVDISWTAPTQSVSGEAINDLVGYYVRWKLASGSRWTDNKMVLTNSYQDDGSSYSWSVGQTYNFEVVAFDSGDVKSVALTGQSAMPAATSIPLTSLAVTDPVPTLHLGVVTLTWDGKMTNGQFAPAEASVLEIHRSLVDNFILSGATLVGTIGAFAGAKFVDGSLTIGNTYYYRTRLRGITPGAFSLESGIVSSRPTGIVDANKITQIIADANITPGSLITGDNIIGMTITGELIQGNEIHADLLVANSIEAVKINTGSITADIMQSGLLTTRGFALDVNGDLSGGYSGAGVTISDAIGIEAWNSSGQKTFELNQANGAITIGGVNPASWALSSQLSDYVANSTLGSTLSNYAQFSDLGAYLLSSTAGSTYITALTAGGLYISKGGGAADDINSNTTEINGGKIITGTIAAGSVSAGTFTGSTFRTSAPNNKRILVSGTSNTIKAYNSGDDDSNPRGTIEGTGTGLELSGYGGSAPTLTIGSTSVQTYGGSSTAPQLLLTSGGAVMYGYASSGSTSDKARLSLTSSAGSIYGPGLDHGIVFYSSYSTWVSSSPRVSALSSSGTSTVSSTSTGELYRGTGSDAGLKDNVEELDSKQSLSVINSVRPVRFNYNSESMGTEKKHFGVIAQELAEVFSEEDSIVGKSTADGKDFLTVEYQELIPVLISSVKELTSTIETLRDRIATLEGESQS